MSDKEGGFRWETEAPFPLRAIEVGLAPSTAAGAPEGRVSNQRADGQDEGPRLEERNIVKFAGLGPSFPGMRSKRVLPRMWQRI